MHVQTIAMLVYGRVMNRYLEYPWIMIWILQFLLELAILQYQAVQFLKIDTFPPCWPSQSVLLRPCRRPMRFAVVLPWTCCVHVSLLGMDDGCVDLCSSGLPSPVLLSYLGWVINDWKKKRTLNFRLKKNKCKVITFGKMSPKKTMTMK